MVQGLRFRVLGLGARQLSPQHLTRNGRGALLQNRRTLLNGPGNNKDQHIWNSIGSLSPKNRETHAKAIGHMDLSETVWCFRHTREAGRVE